MWGEGPRLRLVSITLCSIPLTPSPIKGPVFLSAAYARLAGAVASARETETPAQNACRMVLALSR